MLSLMCNFNLHKFYYTKKEKHRGFHLIVVTAVTEIDDSF